MPNLSTLLTTLRENNLANAATKEVIGSNLPHMAMVMNRFEFIDQAMIQLGNTFTVFIENSLLSKGLEKLTRQLNPQVFANRSSVLKNKTAVLWGMLGKEGFLYTNMASYMLAIPNLRNGMMIRLTGRKEFAGEVGLQENQAKDDPAEIKKLSGESISRFFKMYGAGLALATGLYAFSQVAMAKRWPVPNVLKTFHVKWGLNKGLYRHLKDRAQIFFWAYPVYAGWAAFSRDKLELVETGVKALGFAFAFSAIPRAIERGLNAKWAGKTMRLVGPGENAAFLAQLLSGMVLYTAIPTCTNLLFRKQRAQRMGLMQPEAPQVERFPQALPPQALPTASLRPNPYPPSFPPTVAYGQLAPRLPSLPVATPSSLPVTYPVPVYRSVVYAQPLPLATWAPSPPIANAFSQPVPSAVSSYVPFRTQAFNKSLQPIRSMATV